MRLRACAIRSTWDAAGPRPPSDPPHGPQILASMRSPAGTMPWPAASRVCPPAWVPSFQVCPASRPAQTVLPRGTLILYTDLELGAPALGCQPADLGGHAVMEPRGRAFTACRVTGTGSGGRPWACTPGLWSQVTRV